jgi:SurA N-terminal domain
MRSTCCRSILLALGFVLAGCGGRGAVVHHGPPPVATVAGSTISHSTLQKYIRYANGFFSAAYPGVDPSTRSNCNRIASPSSCGTVRQQVLARLLQQQVVLQYARTHHVHLTAADKQHIDAGVKSLLDPTSDTAGLYGHRPATVQFLRTVLQTESLVLKVENSVVGTKATSGLEYHIEKISIPPARNARKRALNLATDGTPVPVDAIVRDEWEAPFRLRPAVAKSLSLAHQGDYIGPYRRHTGYLVLHILGKGQHKYGRPAHVALLTQLFQNWLRVHMAAAHPRCYEQGDRAACALAMMKQT